jgi:hypothetical protein
MYLLPIRFLLPHQLKCPLRLSHTGETAVRIRRPESFLAAKVQFIEAGLAALGEEAEEELVALAEKYL